MDTESLLKKIKTQIKYDRVAEADEALKNLLKKEEGSDKEHLVLEVFVLDLLKNINRHQQAIPLLERLLSLNITDNLRSRALDFLDICKKEGETHSSEPDPENHDFVEFMNDLRRKEIFNFAPLSIDLKNYCVIQNLDEAKKTAWHQEIKSPYKSWNSLRTQASKEVHDHIFKNKLSREFFSKKVNPEIIRICDENITSVMMHFYDDIYGDLLEIARGKLVGVTPYLHQTMWKAYQKQLFPCGWLGNFPDGRMVVFSSNV